MPLFTKTNEWCFFLMTDFNSHEYISKNLLRLHYLMFLFTKINKSIFFWEMRQFWRVLTVDSIYRHEFANHHHFQCTTIMYINDVQSGNWGGTHKQFNEWNDSWQACSKVYSRGGWACWDLNSFLLHFSSILPLRLIAPWNKAGFVLL